MKRGERYNLPEEEPTKVHENDEKRASRRPKLLSAGEKKAKM
jgi:hypothetical protein